MQETIESIYEPIDKRNEIASLPRSKDTGRLLRDQKKRLERGRTVLCSIRDYFLRLQNDETRSMETRRAQYSGLCQVSSLISELNRYYGIFEEDLERVRRGVQFNRNIRQFFDQF